MGKTSTDRDYASSSMSNNVGHGGDNHTEDASPPQHLTSDYVEMVYLGVVIVVGVGINLHVLCKLLQEKKKNGSNKSMNGFLLLKINLNISDLLILTIHAFGKLIWLYEYEWRFGRALCRTFNFLSMFTLYLSSNIVVCIALDRLRTVLKAKRIILLKKKRHLIRIFLTTAWMLAFLWSLPQLCFWRTYNVFPDYPGGWIQCTDIWSIERYERYLHIEHQSSDSIFLSDFVQNLHDITHLFFVFYGPVAVLIICYLFISIRLMRYAAAANNMAGANCAINTSMASVNTMQTDPSRGTKYGRPIRLSLTTTSTAIVNTGSRKFMHGEPPPQVHRRQSAFPSSCKVPNIPHIIYEHPNSTANESDQEVEHIKSARNTTTMVAQLKRKERRLHRSLSSSYVELGKKGKMAVICNSIPPTRPFLNKLRQADSKGKEQSSTSLTVPPKPSPMKSVEGLKKLVRQQDCSCSSNSSAEAENLLGATYSEISYNDYSLPASKPICHPTAAVNISAAANPLSTTRSSLSTPSESVDKVVDSNRLRNDSIINNGLIRIRRSFRMVASEVCDKEGVSSRNGSVPSFKLPFWRRHLSSRVFRTTLLVILAHVLLWTPYNVYALMKYANEDMYSRMNEQANIFKDLQFLITIINPFLYGFTN